MGRAIVAAAKRLRENGFAPAFVAPSTVDMANALPWIEEIAKVPGAMEHVAEFSYHRYRNSTRENAQRIGDAGARYGKPTSMLEWWFGNGNYRVLREDLTTANNASWQGQVIRTLFKVDFADPKAQRVSIAQDTRQNLQYYRYIRFGAQRVGATSDDADYTRPSAFVNRDGGLVVVTDTKSAVALRIHGAPPGTYAVSFALVDGRFGELDPVVSDPNGDLLVKMPGAGVITVSALPATTPR
jgi:hypothetical protein